MLNISGIENELFHFVNEQRQSHITPNYTSQPIRKQILNLLENGRYIYIKKKSVFL